MNAPPVLSVTIPAVDEIDGIGGAIRRVVGVLNHAATSWELLIVIDGNPDEMTRRVHDAALGDPRIRVLVNDRNRGKGYSVRRGILASRGRIVGFLDADLAQPIEALPAFLSAIESGAGLAIGARVGASAARMTPSRRLASAAFSGVVRLVLGLPVRDTQCGMKFFDGDVGRALCRAQRLERFAFDGELLMLAQAWGLRIAEVPLVIEPSSASTVRLLRDGAHMLIEIARARYLWWSGAYGGRPTIQGDSTAPVENDAATTNKGEDLADRPAR